MSVTVGVASSVANDVTMRMTPYGEQGAASAVGPSSPYYEDTWRRYWCLTSFFPIVNALVAKI